MASRSSHAADASQSKSGSLENPSPNIQPRPNYGQAGSLTRSPSTFPVAISALDAVTVMDDYDPDDLLTKHTVSEVRTVQQRLRANAEAKQEELRLMVGERYRDLLQASTSIISIAESSKRVLEVFHEMCDIVGAAKLPCTPKRSSTSAEDEHLEALQSLSAHLKLLLDAPEHLWRFMERKLYLHAAWLFMTARAVHRTLLRGGGDADQKWQVYAIDVSEQMPIVHRQWEAISQFRVQITQKATVSLREHMISPEEVCATLLTLHLLESRPLSETLTIYLTQRSKALSFTLSHLYEHHMNGDAHASVGNGKTSSRAHKANVREIKQRLQTVLEIICGTLGTAREIFADNARANKLSMMKQTLQYIQTGSMPAAHLPAELEITTRSLLNSLPASTHFLLLPESIRSYKPYVDGTSLSSSIPQAQLDEKLDAWFTQSMSDLGVVLRRWFSALEGVREVWEIRTSSFDLIETLDGIQAEEKSRMRSFLDDHSRRQAVVVWKSALETLEMELRKHLSHAIETVRQKPDEALSDMQSIEFLFEVPSPQHSFEVNMGSLTTASSFRRYKASIERRMQGRTSLLDEVLGSVESQARSLKEDLEGMQAVDAESCALAQELRELYKSDAEALCTGLVTILEHATDTNTTDETDACRRTSLFVGQAAYKLASTSSFITTIGCDELETSKFRKLMHAICDSVMQRWMNHVLKQIIATYASTFTSSDISRQQGIASSSVTSVSPALVHVLFLLSSSLHDISVYLEPAERTDLIANSLRDFFQAVRDSIQNAEQKGTTNQTDVQHFYDMIFLRKLACEWKSRLPDVLETLDHHLAATQKKLSQANVVHLQLDVDGSIAEYLSRTQTLLSLLLPPHDIRVEMGGKTQTHDQSNSLLPCGIPAVGQHLQPAMELVKPSARFGLLLVGGAALR
ncbi:uncharacterized protein LAESUDRAFT_706143 [Laetiporus sulphureus 93-53]|uniref:Conserved oligomeric Golgi complex subunit 1 n=1 Tax=Laetiporus sulphureus 93-53 TaxID=1314785 RepID=A0A165C9V4_9APHY|nr:uncharacterized protein LAESUDRAFT_706143 [Laetiporus sulphureus 93-53]KZT02444.1 hypothetical protein LAESUDRAFT_706143 [Laetiporus sulphureus 93-53]